ncbi:unnamed protein product, partial [Ixodes hexagonus]
MGKTGYTCVRHTLCCYNLLFWILGCGMTGVGVWLHVAYGGYSTVLPTYRMLSADGLCLTAGVVTFLVAFLGCCGAWFQSRCMLVTYFVLVILIFLLEFAAGTLGFVYRRHVSGTHYPRLEPWVYFYPHCHRCGDTGAAEMWRKCAGLRNYRVIITTQPESSWEPILVVKNYQKAINTGEPAATGGNNLFDTGALCPQCLHMSVICMFQGCYQKLHMWIMKRLYIVGIVCMSFAFVQLFGLISAMLLLCTASEKRKKKHSRYV